MPKKFDHVSKVAVVLGVPISIGLVSDHPFLAEYRIWITVEPKDKPKETRYLAWDTGGLVTTYVSKTKDGAILLWNGVGGALRVDPVTGKIGEVKENDWEVWKRSLVGRFYWDPDKDAEYRYFTEEEFKKAYGSD